MHAISLAPLYLELWVEINIPLSLGVWVLTIGQSLQGLVLLSRMIPTSYKWRLVKVQVGGSSVSQSDKEGLKENFKKKCIRRKSSPLNLALRDDVCMANVISLSYLALVNRLRACGVTLHNIRVWSRDLWYPILGYTPDSYAQTKGWFVTIFQNLVDVGENICYLIQHLIVNPGR